MLVMLGPKLLPSALERAGLSMMLLATPHWSNIVPARPILGSLLAEGSSAHLRSRARDRQTMGSQQGRGMVYCDDKAPRPDALRGVVSAPRPRHRRGAPPWPKAAAVTCSVWAYSTRCDRLLCTHSDSTTFESLGVNIRGGRPDMGALWFRQKLSDSGVERDLVCWTRDIGDRNGWGACPCGRPRGAGRVGACLVAPCTQPDLGSVHHPSPVDQPGNSWKRGHLSARRASRWSRPTSLPVYV